MRLIVAAVCIVAVTRPKARPYCLRSCGSVEQSSVLLQSAYDLFTYLDHRKCVICICVCMYIYVCVHTSIYCVFLLPLHMDLQQARKYVISPPCIPYLKFYGVVQIGNVSNCKLEVLKNEIYYPIVEKYMGMRYPPKYRFHNCWWTELRITARCWYLYCHVTAPGLKGGSTENMRVLYKPTFQKEVNKAITAFGRIQNRIQQLVANVLVPALLFWLWTWINPHCSRLSSIKLSTWFGYVDYATLIQIWEDHYQT